MSFYRQYVKYKTRYFNLLNSLEGGGKRTRDQFDQLLEKRPRWVVPVEKGIKNALFAKLWTATLGKMHPRDRHVINTNEDVRRRLTEDIRSILDDVEENRGMNGLRELNENKEGEFDDLSDDIVDIADQLMDDYAG